MAAGIDMLHHYGPLSRSKNTNTQNNMIDATASQDTFDYTRFRKHFATFFDRIVRLASNDTKLQTSSVMELKTVESQVVAQKAEIENKPDVNTETWHDILNVKPMQSTTGAVKRLKPFQKSSTLEAVEDDEEDEADDDAEDLRKMGYKKEYGCKEKHDENESEWLNEDFKLPSSEELFSDLGIWW